YDHNFNEPSNQFPVSATGYFLNGYFFKDHSKTLWYGFRGSLNKEVPPSKKQMALYQHNENEPFSLPSGYIRNLYEDSRRRVWVATNTSLVRYIPERDHFEEIQFFPESESAKRANEILEDSEGLIWITTEDGLYLFDESTQSCKKIPDLPGRAVGDILEDHLHRLWISVWEKGIYVLDKYSFDILKSFEPVEGDSTSLLSKRIRTMYQDSENRIWAGDEYDNGLGLFRLNDSETGFIHYNSAPKASNYIFSNEIRFLAEDSENQLWVGTDGGLQRYDPANDRFQVYPDLINLPSITAYAIDAEGEFWLGTYSGGGLVRMRSEGSGIFGESKGLLHNDTGMSIHTRKLPVDHLGRIYYPTLRGLSVFDPKTETFQNYFEKY
ncbi:MAG: hypothetical protein KDD63_07265, partial [Bacteroidetes bacterium]|nr:hypothetical protein [Bacteroidota bacterium]